MITIIIVIITTTFDLPNAHSNMRVRSYTLIFGISEEQIERRNGRGVC